MSAKLIVVSGKSAGRAIALKNGRLLIGRAESCDVRPLGEEVSRKHCAIVMEPTGLTVEDLGSRNGTFVNDVKITAKVALGDGDTVRVGPLALKVSTVSRVGPAAADDVSRWLMEDDAPAGVFDTTQTINAADSTPGTEPVVPQASVPEAAAAAADAAVSNTPPPAAADDSAARAAASVEALLASKGKPGTLPQDAKKAKSDSSRDAAADALRKFFGKR